MTSNDIKMDHVEPIHLFDISKDKKLGEAFFWKNTQPLLKKIHQQKGLYFTFPHYQLHFVKAYQFIKLSEEGHNEHLHR